jgi:dihydroxyacetone kinase
MLDALLPAVEAFEANQSDAARALAAAATSAEAGAAATAALRPQLGRASYLGDRAIGIADGGATAVAIWLRALATAFETDRRRDAQDP